MLVPNPNRAFQSPGVQSLGVKEVCMAVSMVQAARAAERRASEKAEASLTQPKMPPWALIISRPTRWNSGK